MEIAASVKVSALKVKSELLLIYKMRQMPHFVFHTNALNKVVYFEAAKPR